MFVQEMLDFITNGRLTKNADFVLSETSTFIQKTVKMVIIQRKPLLTLDRLKDCQFRPFISVEISNVAPTIPKVNGKL